jgi:glycosyltransferase involved in cell wall biosynthesis
MRVLFAASIIREKGDVDSFLMDVAKEFAKRVEHIYIVCFQCDKHPISDKITIISCPFRLPLLRVLWLFLIGVKLTLLQQVELSLCFISETMCLILSLCSKLTRKRCFFWYCSVYHNRSLKIILSLKLASRILTCSEKIKHIYAHSFGINSAKIFNIGHGIRMEKFCKTVNTNLLIQRDDISKPFTIVSVARISPVKEWEKIVFAANQIREKKNNIKVMAVGSPPAFSTSRIYFNRIKKLIKDLKLDDVWQFVGSVPNDTLINFYREADVVILPGYAYKTILESLAAGKITLFEKKSASLIFPPDVFRKIDILTFTDYLSLSQRLLALLNNKKPFIEATNYLSNFVIREFSVEQYVSKILRLAREYK